MTSGESLHSANIAGGLHHAMADRSSGLLHLQRHRRRHPVRCSTRAYQRIAYVDVDVHHGDGVERIFYDDPRVLTISLHETGQMLFPGTGFPHDTGGPGAEGTAVNVALPPGTADAGWLRAFHAVVPPLLRAFEPEILVTQHGCDSHMEDPLAHLMLTVDGQRASYVALHDLAHEVCGRAVGGHRGWRLRPRRGRAAGLDPPARDRRRAPARPETPTPPGWRAHVSELLGRTPPHRMTDGRTPAYRDWADGYDPETWLDRAIMATRDRGLPAARARSLPLSVDARDGQINPTRRWSHKFQE